MDKVCIVHKGMQTPEKKPTTIFQLQHINA
jgi:hypothetical protein